MKDHINYGIGAFGGTLVGSSFLHCADTIAARKFSNVKATPLNLAKNMATSFMPVAIGIVPMRAISFGLYSAFQDKLITKHNFGTISGKTIAAIGSGICLAFLTTPAEILKTRKQIESKYTQLGFLEIKKNFFPTASRIVPTMACMLVGTEAIQMLLPSQNIIFSTSCASFVAATVSQAIATPSDNIRIYRIQQQDYASSLLTIFKKLQFSRLYIGFAARSLALGIQSSFTLSAANLAKYKDKKHEFGVVASNKPLLFYKETKMAVDTNDTFLSTMEQERNRSIDTNLMTNVTPEKTNQLFPRKSYP